jgi:hypothetical protein
MFVCNCYPATAEVHLLFLPSNGSTCYNIFLSWKFCMNVKPLNVIFQPPGNNRMMAKQKSLPLDPALTEMNPVCTFTTYYLKTYLNIILPFRCLKWSLFWNFLAHILNAFLIYASSASCLFPCHPLFVDHSNNIWLRVQIMKVLIVQFFSILLLLPLSLLQH